MIQKEHYGGYFDDYHGHHYPHHPPSHHYHHEGALLKGLLIPLAGVALLGAAAIFVTNPILLQLGVISGKRKKRGLLGSEIIYQEKMRDIQALEKFIDKVPKDLIQVQEKKLLASYLSCSEENGVNRCLERVTCELQNPQGNLSSLEKNVLNIVTGQIIRNEFISSNFKERIRKAEKLGQQQGNCKKYYCSETDD